MKPQTIPAMQIEPDLFGKLNISVAIEGYEATPNGVMKWIADAARLNRNFIPSLASRDIAERLNISRRTLEGYRTGIKVPVVTCWLLKVLLEEIRNNASGLVLSSTPSETATREDAGQGHLFDEVGKTMVKLSKARRKGGKGSDTQSKATAYPHTPFSPFLHCSPSPSLRSPPHWLNLLPLMTYEGNSSFKGN
jgi:hypothetical protein